VALNQDFVAAGLTNGAIWLWDRKSGTQIRQPDTDVRCSFNDVGRYVSALALTPDNILAVGDLDGRVYFWNLTEYRSMRQTDYRPFGEMEPPHTSYVSSFTISPELIVSLSADNTAQVWNRFTCEPIGVPREWPTQLKYGVTMSVNGTSTMTPEDTDQETSPEKLVDRANTVTGSRVSRIIGHDDDVFLLCASGLVKLC
jgi:WD40 repeat protein